MEIYWSPSNYSTASVGQGVQGIITSLPAIPPFFFLLYLQFTRREIFNTYKYSVFATSYICFSYSMINLSSFIWLYFAGSIQLETNALFCYFGKSFGYFFSQYSFCYLLVLAFYRFCTIVLHFEVPIWALLITFLLAYSRDFLHIIFSLFFGELGFNNSCNPILTTNLLGGYFTVLLWIVGCDLVTMVFNACILVHLRLHYKQVKGRSQSFARQKAQRNLQIGLLVSSIWPAITHSYTAYQVTSALSQQPIPWFIDYPCAIFTRSALFFAATPFLFIRSFQDELIFLITRRRTAQNCLNVQTVTATIVTSKEHKITPASARSAY